MDFKNYVEQKLLEIEDLNDRRAMRGIMQEILIPLHQTVQENNARLEAQIIKEEDTWNQQFEIVCGIAERGKYDVTDKKMKPMLERDLKEPEISFEQVCNAIANKTELYLFSVFIKADYLKLAKLAKENIEFHGNIVTEEGEYPAVFQLKPSKEYITKMKELYQAFTANGVKWNTPCSVYLNKMFDVYLISGEMVDGESVREISVDFGEYASCIKYNTFPIWNIRKIKEKTSYFPVPCEGGKQYEHKIYRERFNQCDCLAVHEHAEITNLYKKDGDLVIVCEEPEITDWELVCFLQENACYYEEPLFTNKMNSWGNYAVRTMAELRKFIKNLGYESYVKLIEVEKTSEHVRTQDTYLMDSFLKDELFFAGESMTLLFQFQAETADNYLNRDILSYIMTRVQWEYPQFQCIGMLV